MIAVDHRDELRHASVLCDPARVSAALGLDKGAQRQGGGGVTVCCPWHSERSPSCSLTRGPDGTLRVKCFGCQKSGDIFSLVAQVHRLDVTRDFPDVIKVVAGLAGYDLDDRSGVRSMPPRPRPAPPVAAERVYPGAADVAAVIGTCGTPDAAALAYLEERGLDVAAVLTLGMVRQCPADTRALPEWTRGWGGRLIFELVDAHGITRSLLARLPRHPRDGEIKSLAPRGFARAGLVIACPSARTMLSAACHPATWTGPQTMRVVITEGEVDALTWMTSGRCDATIGVYSGGWTVEHAHRIAWGAQVLIATDLDLAGDGYAAQILETLRAARRNDLRVMRWAP